MKNIKQAYKFLFILPLVMMVGCISSDDVNDVLTATSTAQENTVFIETDDTHETPHLAATNNPVDIEVGLNNAQTTDTSVSFSVIRDGSEATYGVDYILDDAVIAAGDYFGSSPITFLTGGSYEVSVASSSNSSLVVVDNRLLFTVPPAVVFTITWDDGFYDYDMYLVTGNQDLGGTVIASSLGVTTIETFEAYPPEGFSSIFIDDWWGDNAGTPVTLTVDVDGDVQTFNIVMDMDKFVLVIETEVGEDGFPVYTFTDLN